MNQRISPERARELTEHTMRIITAIADRDRDAMPARDACGPISNAEWWGMVCAALAVIDQFIGTLDPGKLSGWAAVNVHGEPVDMWAVDPAKALGATILTKWRSGDREDACRIAFEQPELAPDASAFLFVLAGNLVRQREQQTGDQR